MVDEAEVLAVFDKEGFDSRRKRSAIGEMSSVSTERERERAF